MAEKSFIKDSSFSSLAMKCFRYFFGEICTNCRVIFSRKAHTSDPRPAMGQMYYLTLYVSDRCLFGSIHKSPVVRDVHKDSKTTGYTNC